MVVDTSALMAIALQKPASERCLATMKTAERMMISAGTVAEALIVAGRRGYAAQMLALIEGFGFEIVPVSLAAAKRVAATYERWGKGVHPAALNFGDCFAYELARHQGCSLLFLGDDFRQTDVVAAL